MLLSLSIENYALIDALNIDFAKGFSTITGETGAGKSILLGALGLLTGQRADSSVMMDPERKCIVEASFKLDGYGLESLFAQEDIDYEAVSTLRRIITPNGKSRAFVNDVPVSLQQLKALSPALIDIHSQHENLLLGEEQFQFRVVDSYAHNDGLIATYSEAYKALKREQKALNDLEERAAKARRELDYLQHQHAELQAAALKSGELSELEHEQEALSHTEDIQTALAATFGQLAHDDTGAIQALSAAMQALRRIADYYPKAAEYVQRIETAYYELKDIAEEAETLGESIEFDPERMQFVEQRIGLYFDLQKKHRCENPDELIALRNKLAGQLDEIENFDHETEQLRKRIASLQANALQLAGQLSQSRLGAIAPIEDYVNQQLQALGMPNGRLQIAHSQTELGRGGMDELEFRFSANKNGLPQPIAKVASGGERSRVMLSLKSLLGHHSKLPTIIFDEIDTGVSGDIADKMGDIMQDMAQHMQVITITHLPQVAVKGAQHFKVYKQDTEHTTQSSIRLLGDAERVEEIAKMLSGQQLTDSALENARSLLNASGHRF